MKNFLKFDFSLSQGGRDVTKFELEFDNIRTSNVFSRFAN